MNSATQSDPGSDQRPVSILGWGLVLIAGGLIWALVFALLAR